jgi:pSer/pThr/pTyr-binding forkhead associated (FHA) protein
MLKARRRTTGGDEAMATLHSRTPPPATHPLWAEGDFALRISGPEPGPSQVLTIGRPYALVGRVAGADIRIDDRQVSARHVYLHLDRRGMHCCDLATRTGTRVGEHGRSSGWIGPGQALEVAGRRIEVEAIRCGDTRLEQAGGSDPLADSGPTPLVKVTLLPARAPEAPLVLASELVFLGRSASCGVRVEGASASRTHCVLVRTRSTAYIVDLAGRGTWLNNTLLQGAVPLSHGDVLTIGSARFEVRVEAPGAQRPAVPALSRTAGPPAPRPGPAPVPSLSGDWFGSEELATLAPPPGLLPAESQAAVLAWMMNVLQASQAEMLRRQDEFHRDITRLIGQMQRDNTALLSKHLERVEAINRELSGLREEIGRRFGSEAPPARAPAPPPPPRATPIPVPPPPPPIHPEAATNWLLSRVNQLEQENRSTWRDLLSRLKVLNRQAPQRP